jgi:stage III sporulation protein SpoIIIAA
MTPEPYTITDNLDELLAVLPNGLINAIAPQDRPSLIEIVLDLGRQPEARYVDRYEYLRESPITREELDYVEERLGTFGDDNRAGLPATLHRISAIRNRRGAIVGLTLRVGRAVTGIVDILRDLIASGESLLLMGRPGLGKTTLLREMARVMADEEGKRVVVVDTSNEIAGDGDVPHPAIGRARRMQVSKVAQQHDVMIEAVENHMPEVIVIDEIGRLEETLAARTIAERGVQLIATVHGNTLDNLLANPAMSDLIGGIQAVTLSDEEARRRRTQKTVLERKAPPTFGVVVEMIERGRITVRRPVADVVDAILRGQPQSPEIRYRDENGEIQTEHPAPEPTQSHPQRDFDMRGGNDARGDRRGRPDERRGKGKVISRSGSRHSRAEENFEDEWAARSFHTGHSSGHVNGHGPSPKAPGALANNASDVDDDASAPDFEDEELYENTPANRLAEVDDVDDDDEDEPQVLSEVPLDITQVHQVYPFGVSRSRLARAIKHLGLPLTLTRTWHDADAVLMLAGKGITAESAFLREVRDLKLPIVGIKGNTYGQILARLNTLFGAAGESGPSSRREMATLEARNAAQRVMSEAEPVELRPQSKPLRRLQHQMAERFHLRSYSVGREPNRRVRFLPNIRQ